MKGMKFAIALLLLIVAYPAEAAEGTPADKLSEIMKRGKMIIATEAEYPPMSELIKGVKRNSDAKCFSNEYTSEQFEGVEIEIAKLVAKYLGVEPCFITPAWSEVVGGRWANRWDISFNSISITLERMEVLYFAQPYLSEPAVFYVHKNNTTFTHPSDLSEKKIGVCSGCIYEYYLDGTLTLPGQKTEYPVKNSEIIAYEPDIKGLSDLSLGDGIKLDAVLTNIFTGNKAILDGMPLKQLGEPVFYTYIAPAIDKKQAGNPIPFIKKVTEIITQLHDDGTLSKLAEKYRNLKTDIITPAKKFDIQALGQY